MKALRLPILFAALFLLLTVPAGADFRATPVIEGPPPSSIEGTITSVHVPFAGGGPILNLLDGLVIFDATGAKVRLPDGTEGKTIDLAAGQRIVAFVDTTVAPLKATNVVILSQRQDVTLTGRVEAVDTTARTLTLLGFKVLTTDKTVFGGPWDGIGKTDLADVKVGDLVLVAARAEEGRLVAARVQSLSPSPDPMVRLSGTIRAIGTDTWTIGGSDATVPATVIKIGPETKIVGEPKVGDVVDILARKQPDGTFLAILIAKSVQAPTVPTIRYQGTVKEITATAWTIGPKVGYGPDRIFAVNDQTRIEGLPKVGDEVGVLAQEQLSGPPLAILIAKVTAAPPVSALTSFDGTVLKISDGTSMGPTPGTGNPTGSATWLIDETSVTVMPTTVINGAPKVGDKVHVEGIKGRFGIVLATSITKL